VQDYEATDLSQSGNVATDRPAQLESLAARCQERGISYEWKLGPESTWRLVVQMPNGKATRRLVIRDKQPRAELLSAEAIGKYTYLGDYEAIASYDDGYIEAAVFGMSRISRSWFVDLPGVEFKPERGVESELPDDPDSSDLEEDTEAGLGASSRKRYKLSIESHEVSWRLEISPPTRDFQALYSRVRSINLARAEPLSLKVYGVTIRTHDQAVHVLETVADSLFFDLDLCHGLAPRLQRFDARLGSRVMGLREFRMQGAQNTVRFPTTRYDREPLALYWYARSAVGMPLLQYLAYYQVLEFYFPIFSRREALTRLRQELRDPRFDLDDDGQLSRVLTIATTAGGSGYGNEREQLKATLRACIDGDWLRELLSGPDLEAFFTGRQRIRGVQALRLADRQHDLCDQVSNRIYDLRCRIVHTKEEGDPRTVGLLLPYSGEADSLENDIDLIQLIAQKVLIARASTLRL
jgi:hypothetical protein